MKFIFMNRKGEVVRKFDDPFCHDLQDILIKPNARIVKIIHKDGYIEEFALVNRTAEMRHELDTDVEEFIMKITIEELGK